MEHLIGKKISVPDPRGGARLMGMCTYAGPALTKGQFQVTIGRMPIWPIDPNDIRIVKDKIS